MPHNAVDVGNVLVTMVDGPLDYEGAPELLSIIDEALGNRRNRFVIDLTRSNEADSVGLEVLVSIAGNIFRQGGRLCLFGATETLAEILRVTRLDQRLAMFASREEALARAREDA